MLTSELINTCLIAEGVETKGEKDYLSSLGIYLMQGYYFCKPVFKGVGHIDPEVWA